MLFTISWSNPINPPPTHTHTHTLTKKTWAIKLIYTAPPPRTPLKHGQSNWFTHHTLPAPPGNMGGYTLHPHHTPRNMGFWYQLVKPLYTPHPHHTPWNMGFWYWLVKPLYTPHPHHTPWNMGFWYRLVKPLYTPHPHHTPWNMGFWSVSQSPLHTTPSPHHTKHGLLVLVSPTPSYSPNVNLFGNNSFVCTFQFFELLTYSFFREGGGREGAMLRNPITMFSGKSCAI